MAGSQVIIIGEVLNAEAHMSNNKGGVYSEFSVRVDEILKNNGINQIAQGSVITMDREGGVVRYPNGQKVFYTVAGKGMPRVGNHYILFLTNADQSINYNILTAYELKNSDVNPLDRATRFENFEGINAAAFITIIRQAIAQNHDQ